METLIPNQSFSFPWVSAEDTDNIVLGDVSELADMKLRGHPLAATRCVVFMWARGLFISGRPWNPEFPDV